MDKHHLSGTLIFRRWTSVTLSWNCFFVLLLLPVFMAGKLWAQNTVAISYPVAAEHLVRGYSESFLYVKIDFGGPCTGTTIRVVLPESVTYVPNTVSKTNTTDLTIEESNITDLRNPEFQVSGTYNPSGNTTLEFRIARRADCGGALEGKDRIYVTSQGGCTDVSEISDGLNAYNILAPALSITPPSAISNAIVGGIYNRTIRVTNGGNGVVDTLRFFVVYPGAGIENSTSNDAITVNGSVNFTPYSTNGDTLFYKIYGTTIFGGDNILSNSEYVDITEPIRVLKCNSSSTFAVQWGRHAGTICVTATASGAITMASGVPNFTSITGQRLNYTNLCTPFDFNLTIINGGTGNQAAAAMYNLSIRHGDQRSDILSGPYDIDTNLIRFYNLRINGHPVDFTWEPGTRIMRINLENQFTSDPDGAGVGLADMDGDGYYDDLPGGATLTLTFSFQAKEVSCGYLPVFYGSAAKLYYNNMCGTSLVSDTRGSGMNNVHLSGYTGIAHVPANILGGTPFQFSAKYSVVQNSNSFRTTQTRYRWKILLPDGFNIAPEPNARYGADPVTNYTVSGDTIIYTSSVLRNFYIDLVYNCGTSGTKQINYYLEEINNIATNPECAMWGKLICASIATVAKCPGPCAAGPTPYRPVIRRADGSLGWTNSDMTTRQSVANISTYDLTKALYLDTIQIEAGARQNNATDNLHIHFSLPKTSLAPIGLNKLNTISLTAKVYRSGTEISSLLSAPFDLSESDAVTQVVHWDLSAGLPSGGLIPGDSIVTFSKYVVATNAGLPQLDIQSGGSWYFYNLNGTEREYCDVWIPEMYLSGTFLINGTNPFNTSGCSPVSLGGGTWHLARRFGGAGQYFETEFRPGFYIDSIVTNIPESYALNSSTLNLTNFPIATPGLATPQSIPVTPDYVWSSQRTYINPGTWRPVNTTVTNEYGATFPINVTPTCATTTGLSTNVKVYIRDYYYAYAEGATPTQAPAGLSYILHVNPGELTTGQTRNIIYSSSGTPNLTIANLTGEVQAIEEEHKWTIRLGNSGLSTAPYSWISIPDHAAINVTEVKDGTVILTPIHYPGGKMYQLSTTGIASGAFKDYEIKFTYTACSRDSLQVLGGWNCSSFPASPSDYSCNMASVYLRVDPQLSQVQLNVARQPGGGTAIDYCTNDSVLLVVNSAQAANLINPYIAFYPPEGVTLPNMIAVEYPLNSGNYQDVGVIPVGDGSYRIALAGHTGIGAGGMKGTLAANPVAYPGGEDRQAKVKLDFSTDCDFPSGSTFSFHAYGERPCGQPAIGNGEMVTTHSLYINGANSANDIALLAIEMDGADTLACGISKTLNLRANYPNISTDDTDELIYELPQGVRLVAGSFTQGTNCSSCTITQTTNSESRDVVRVKMTPGIAAGTDIRFSFDVTSEIDATCGIGQITGQMERIISGLECGGNDCGDVRAINGYASPLTVAIVKPVLRIDTLLPVSGTTLVSGTTANVELVYSNIGSGTADAGMFIVEFFTSASAMVPAFTHTLGQNTLPGADNSEIFSLNIPLIDCDADPEIIAKVSFVTTGNITQCLCDATTKAVADLTVIEANVQTVDVINACSPDKVDLTASAVTEGSTSDLTYTYFNSDYSVSYTPVQASEIAENGIYHIVGTSVSGCRDTGSVIITINPKPTVVTHDPVAVCQPNTIDLTAPAVTVASTAGLTYNYFTDAEATIPLSNSSAVSESGTYYIVGTTTSGCSDTTAVTVTINPKPTVVTHDPDAVCQPNTIDLTAPTVTANSTIGLTYAYFTDAEGTTPLSNPSAVSESGTYYIVGTTALGCSDTTSIIVTINPKPTVVTHDPDAVCQPNTIDLTAAAVTATSTAGLAYTYFTDAEAAIPLSNPSAVSESGTYYIVGTTALGCSDTTAVTITIHPKPTVVTHDPATVCQPNTINLTAPAVTATSTTGLTYSYFTDAEATIPLSNPSAVSESGTYYIVGTTALGCSDTTAVTVTIHPKPTVVTHDPDAVCQPHTIDLTAAAVTATSTSGLTYSYFTDAEATIPLSNPSVVSESGIYYIVGTTLAGCSDTTAVMVTINPKPTVVTHDPDAVCHPNTIDLTAAAVTANSTIGLTYAYFTDGEATIPLSNPSAVSESGTYYIVGTTASGCSDTTAVTVTIHPKPTVVTHNPDAVCHPNTIDLTAAAVTANSTIGLTYAYFTDAEATIPLGNPSVVSESGTYYIVGTTVADCSDTTEVTVTINAKPVLYAQNPSPLCRPDSIDLSATVGADMPVTYTYYTTDYIRLAGPVIHTAGTNQIYHIIGTTAAGCSDTVSVAITIYPQPVLVTQDVTICSNSSFNLAHTIVAPTSSGLQYAYFVTSLNPANQLTGDQISNATAGVYYIIGTDQNGCRDTAAVFITENQRPVAFISGNKSLCSGTSSTVTIISSPAVEVTYTINHGANLVATTGIDGSVTLPLPIWNTTVDTQLVYRLVSATGNNCSSILNDSLVINMAAPANVLADISGPSCAGAATSIYFYGTANALVNYNINSGANQTLQLDGNGNGIITPTFTDNATISVLSVMTDTTVTPGCLSPINSTLPIRVNTIPEIDSVQIECNSAMERFTARVVARPGTISAGTVYYISEVVPSGIQVPPPNATGVFELPMSVTSVSFEAGNNDCNSQPYIVLAPCAEVLPVDFVDIIGNCNAKSEATIKWKVANERNVNYYVLERSHDAKVYDSLQYVRALAENVTLGYYSTVDTYAENSGYYRIRQVDYDGQFGYSQVIRVNCAYVNSVKLYPNPAKEMVTFEYTTSVTNGNIQYWITDGLSRKMGNVERVDSRSGTNKVSVSISHLIDGVYYFHYILPGSIKPAAIKFSRQLR